MDHSAVVTVCIPTIGNRPAMLAETIRSLQSQSFGNYEVLLLDNASPAESEAFLRQYASAEPRARILRSSQRIHMFDNFSRGVCNAAGKYLTFFHDDDVYDPTFLERHVALHEQNPRMGISGSNWRVVNESGRILRQRNLIRATSVWNGTRYIETLLGLGVNILPMQGIVYRTCTLHPKTFDSSMSVHHSDYIFLMRIAERWDVGLLADTLLSVRSHAGQESQQLSSVDYVTLRTQALLKYCAEFGQRWPEKRSLRRRFERRVGRSRWLGVLWGWLSSATEQPATDCLAAWNQSAVERATQPLLRNLRHYGLRLARARTVVGPLRTICYALGRQLLVG